MAADQIPNRYELKYTIPESATAAIRQSVQPFCVQDKNAAKSGGRYIITSLYFDSPQWECLRAKKERCFTRFKLRVRTYGELSDGPVFAEVKRKFGDVIIKNRRLVDKENWVEDIIGDNPETQDFRSLMKRWQAGPVLLVRYEREPFMSVVDDYARVTFDRKITYQACRDWDLLGDPRAWRSTDDVYSTRNVPRALVLELKCTQSVPAWMLNLIRRHGLQQSSYSKYCNGAERILRPGLLSDADDRVARHGRSS